MLSRKFVKLFGRWKPALLPPQSATCLFTKSSISSRHLTEQRLDQNYGNQLPRGSRTLAHASIGVFSQRHHHRHSRFPLALIAEGQHVLPCPLSHHGHEAQFSMHRVQSFHSCSHLLRQSVRGSRWTAQNMSLMSSVVDKAPNRVQPYLRLIRLDKPTGTWLVYWPCAWGIALAADPGHFPSLYMLALCGLGALVVRGAGCTINDMWDRDFDKSVERTSTRPIASGAVSESQALVFLGAQLSVALGILLTLNPYSITLGCMAMILIVVYPLMKRFTHWPQIFLGVTTNFSALIGYAAVHGSCDWSIVLPLYVSCIAWTIVYDTIYGHQDKKDDLALGLGSASIVMGDNTRYWLTGFGAAMVAGLVLVGATAEQTAAYYLAVALTAAHIGNQVWTVDINNPRDCWSKFRSNNRLGAIIFAGIIAGTLAKASTTMPGSAAESDEKKQCAENRLDELKRGI
ncbi:4-hydroxybenzoate polyprenyltransferase, mitochondrial-like [Acanthaster planci]|uniref:4-hydroxybenzoate polyprenyltransferase, mitochondrial n=1 Tax=Acanthaster planci TaxID=133434 RepID=A0A8B7YE61_ACAPL|nr:4-hydroxybenzoate polyprenyltransferase, mitochondrial-like [Acanthaster planci]